MNVEILLASLGSVQSFTTHLVGGLTIGMLLFLVASGLSLIFGVLGVINFAHGVFYMLGAYFTYSAYVTTGSYTVAMLAAGLGCVVLGVLFEKLFAVAHVYGSNVLMQVLLCYACILIFDDLVKIVWGASYISMGMPETFRLPPLQVAGAVIPPFYVFSVGTAIVIGIAQWYLMGRTRFGSTVRAAAQNRAMLSALGVNTSLVYAAVFGLACSIAGLAGALAAPVRPLTSGMGFSILIDSFTVIVIGGMGSILGAFVASVIVGLTRSFGSSAFPLFVDGLVFLLMIVVLILKPSGLFARKAR